VAILAAPHASKVIGYNKFQRGTEIGRKSRTIQDDPGRSGTIGPRPVGKQFKAEEKQEEEAPREKRA